MEKLGIDEKYGKRRQITFRVDELAWQRLKQHAELFDMKEGQYAKAVLYANLGVFGIPLDRRKRSWRRRKRE